VFVNRARPGIFPGGRGQRTAGYTEGTEEQPMNREQWLTEIADRIAPYFKHEVKR